MDIGLSTEHLEGVRDGEENLGTKMTKTLILTLKSFSCVLVFYCCVKKKKKEKKYRKGSSLYCYKS